MDGQLDSAGYLLMSNTLPLCAAIRGNTLYVATASPGTSGPNDVFIFVTDQLLPAGAVAPWAKGGTVAVATTKPYLATESQNSYVSWYVNGSSAAFPCAKSATTNGVLEGTLDLTQAFGSVPATLYICAAAYATVNGGALAAQVPAGSGGNIDTNEFLAIPSQALADTDSNGLFDRLEPNLGFRLLGLQPAGTGYFLNWASMPLRNYQVLYLDTWGNAWSNLYSTNAGSLQMSLGYTDAPGPASTQRFYRVKLLP